ncbi:natural cytotoxicity triggering receptor 3 ligand 1-like [Acipenser oxyrinchus oxyrinchus]|uniref:Natural cytotoxicity triggering receptor 3 ligand 1-like n=1 Tax=Acipenser oxyrinchus oxyrinchus TaxID=40147 RepID=A0AAD8CJ42_ACIOX|nr:natural cytotoxicity triggering receptor 3 ligand 1-like [Acipenser oxyrinchus oxyrinchus]
MNLHGGIYCLWAFCFTGTTVGNPIKLLLSPSHLSLLAGENATLSCRLNQNSGFKSYFYWKAVKQHPTAGENKTSDFIEEKGRFSISTEEDSPPAAVSTLLISDVSPYDHGRYFCAVHLLGDTTHALLNGTYIQLDVKARPQLSLTSHPSNTSGSRILSCSAVGYYPPDVSLSWDGSSIGVLSPTPQGPPTLHRDGSYSTSSTLLVTEALWITGAEIACVLSHSSLTEPLRKSIRQEDTFSDAAVITRHCVIVPALVIEILCVVYFSLCPAPVRN